MLKDIPFDKVQDIAMAIVPERDEKDIKKWDVYILNFKDESISTVLIVSKGYGTIDEKKIKTSVLRHHIEKLASKSFKKVEIISDTLLNISHEFWVSFRYNGQVYDKKYVFVTESLVESNFIDIPLVKKQGVMIK